jgi:uncharacterized protein YkwD
MKSSESKSLTQGVSSRAESGGMTIRRTAPLLAAVMTSIAVLLAPPTVAAAGAATIDRAELAEVGMINRFRAQRGLARLRIDATLTRAAGWHARDLGRTARFSHVDSLGRDPFERLRAFGYPSRDTWRGENIAAGHPGAHATWLQWLNSPPHRATWLIPRFRAIGIARVRVPGSPYEWYWATTFGSRWTAAASS